MPGDLDPPQWMRPRLRFKTLWCAFWMRTSHSIRDLSRDVRKLRRGNLGCNGFISFHLCFNSFMTLSELRLNNFVFVFFLHTVSLWIRILCFSESDPQSITSAALHGRQTCKETGRWMDNGKSAPQGVNQPHRGLNHPSVRRPHVVAVRLTKGKDSRLTSHPIILQDCDNYMHAGKLTWNLKNNTIEKEHHLPTLHFWVPC